MLRWRSLWLLLGFSLPLHATEKAPSPSKPQVEEPFMEVRYGDLSQKAKHNKQSNCIITRAHPEVAKTLADWDKTLTEAAKAEWLTAMHIAAQVPSVQIIGYMKANGKLTPVDLFIDYSTMKYRKGQAADQLVTLAKRLCPAQ